MGIFSCRSGISKNFNLSHFCNTLDLRQQHFDKKKFSTDLLFSRLSATFSYPFLANKDHVLTTKPSSWQLSNSMLWGSLWDVAERFVNKLDLVLRLFRRKWQTTDLFCHTGMTTISCMTILVEFFLSKIHEQSQSNKENVCNLFTMLTLVCTLLPVHSQK